MAQIPILRAFGLQMSCRLSLVLRLFCFVPFSYFCFHWSRGPSFDRSSMCMRPDCHTQLPNNCLLRPFCCCCLFLFFSFLCCFFGDITFSYNGIFCNINRFLFKENLNASKPSNQSKGLYGDKSTINITVTVVRFFLSDGVFLQNCTL